MKKAKKLTLNTKVKVPKKDRELPVTKRLLDLKIQEVKGDVTSLRLEMKAGFSKMDARFAQIDSRFQEQDARFAQIDSRFAQIDLRFQEQDVKLTKMLVLLEDQNDRNHAVLDSYTTVYEKLLDTDSRVDKVEERVFGSKQK